MNTTSFLQLYVHLVWATWDRLRLITPRVEQVLRPALLAKATELGCTTLAVGAVEDHVHHLLMVPATLPVATIAGELKGVSSFLVNQELGRGEFKWQAGYGGFTVSKSHLDRVERYVQRQREHHSLNRLCADLERIHADQKDREGGPP